MPDSGTPGKGLIRPQERSQAVRLITEIKISRKDEESAMSPVVDLMLIFYCLASFVEESRLIGYNRTYTLYRSFCPLSTEGKIVT